MEGRRRREVDRRGWRASGVACWREGERARTREREWYLCVCVCVRERESECVCEKTEDRGTIGKRERERERGSERGRERDRQTDRQTARILTVSLSLSLYTHTHTHTHCCRGWGRRSHWVTGRHIGALSWLFHLARPANCASRGQRYVKTSAYISIRQHTSAYVLFTSLVPRSAPPEANAM